MFYNVLDAFRTVYISKLFYDYGKLDNLDTTCTVQEDFWYSMIYEALESVSGFSHFTGGDWESKYYFSDPAMLAYYRRCRDYCRLFGVSLKDNPFMQKAEDFVDNMLRNISGYYGWTLLTKINHHWASGIVFAHDNESFNADAFSELIEALLEIFSFYENELKVLEEAVSGQKNRISEKEAA